MRAHTCTQHEHTHALTHVPTQACSGRAPPSTVLKLEWARDRKWVDVWSDCSCHTWTPRSVVNDCLRASLFLITTALHSRTLRIKTFSLPWTEVAQSQLHESYLNVTNFFMATWPMATPLIASVFRCIMGRKMQPSDTVPPLAWTADSLYRRHIYLSTSELWNMRSHFPVGLDSEGRRGCR